MNYLIISAIVLCIAMLIPFVIWRIDAANAYKQYLPLTKSDLDYYETKTPIFTKYWISNSLYKDYIDKTRMIISNSNEKFDFSQWGIALKMEVYKDVIVLYSMAGLFIEKRAIELHKISKIFKNNRVVAFKGANITFLANDFSANQIAALIKMKG